MDPAGEGSTFLTVDEVGEANGPAETPGAGLQQGPGDELWLEESGQPGKPPDSSTEDASDLSSRPSLARDAWTIDTNQSHAPPNPEDSDPSNDSISLAQLKKIVMDVPKKEPTPYSFQYRDTSTFEEELEELFGYSIAERELLLQPPFAYEHGFKSFYSQQNTGASNGATMQKHAQRLFCQSLRSRIEDPDVDLRILALQSVLYMALGCWEDNSALQDGVSLETSNLEPALDPRYTKYAPQIQKIKSNLCLIGQTLGFELLFRAFRTACTKDDQNGSRSYNPTFAFDRESLVDSNVEYWTSCKLLCILVDFARCCSKNKENETLRKDVSRLSPALLQFMTQLIADWRWDESGATPPMNLLSLYWKTVLLTFGGIQDMQAIKQSLNGDRGPQKDETRPLITASPLDYHLFRQEITSKYPAFNPPEPVFPFEPESNSMFSPAQEWLHRSPSDSKLAGSTPGGMAATASSIIHQPVHISTPAPSPPPSPAGPGGKGIKKQNYQTNQMFPFLYPPLEESSNAIGGKGSTELQDALAGRKWLGSDIPASILEAADLFAKRMRATRAMKQLWDERVRFMKYERGYDPPPAPQKGESDSSVRQKGDDSEQDPSMALLDEVQKERLEKVEQYYANEAPHFQSLVIVLLKVLLQTVTTLVTQPNLQNGFQGSFDGQDPTRQQSNGDIRPENENTSMSILQNLDTMRAQEIMGKAVSGVLFLLLKWFKLSHVLKFEHLTQLLLDSNYAHLVLKMSTYQDLERVVNFKCERKSLNLFEFCFRSTPGNNHLASEDDDDIDPDDAAPPPIRQHRNTNGDSLDDFPASVTRTRPPELDEQANLASEPQPETISEFSWRNFFTNINHLRILQKIVKNKAHRQLMMVQYKFSNVLKKALKVPQPDIRLYTLKIIKGQVPYCHRKWRQNNMRIITAIYLHCKPELRDDWLAGLAVDEEMSEALPQEQALRSLTYWYNLRRYPDVMGSDREKAQGLLEEEQDFFVRELDTMEAAAGRSRGEYEPMEGDDAPDFGQRIDNAQQFEGW